ncbi:MAP kinase kinase kinase wis4 [Elsinoe australis]|uniref:Autophagy-related protein 1 n=1 Tax=Elsinoe australis TaxID=40998 RepID=A0A2P7Z2D0_9PEZI|nr:MAP kinase kinase kinase wis4 [Elsinoe australis]
MYERQRPQPIRVVSDTVTADLQAACMPFASQDPYVASLQPSIITEVSNHGQASATSHSVPMLPGHVARSTTIPVRSSPQLGHNGVISPPSTPPMRSPSNSFSQHEPRTPVLKAVIDDLCINIDDGELLGSGLWSNVFKVTAPTVLSHPSLPGDLLTPPTSPQKSTTTQVYAVKIASRPDAKEVFTEEARTLDYLQSHPSSSSFIIPFHGLANASTALIFHCASTTLQSYSSSLPLADLLPTLPSIFTQLLSGLSFLHSLSLIHADIKPANILLDHRPNGPPLARFADFSASFLSALPASYPILDPTLPASPASSAPVSRNNSQKKPSAAAGGGTWAFMAPEQLNSNPSINEPSYASDVYSLGITLLTTLLGGESPYREMEGQNVFLYREAIKMGDAVGFVKRDAGLRKRLGEVEGGEVGRKLVEGLRLGVRKNKAERVSAEGWRAWGVENLGL